MKEIQLTQGKVALVDDIDYPTLSTLKWYAMKTPAGFYAIRSIKKPSRKAILLHRVVLCPPTGMSVDHINGDTLDNRRSNLRIATHGQNMMNRKTNCLSVSGLKGVRRSRRSQRRERWEAGIYVDNKRVHLGTFDTSEEAARAFDKAAFERYGSFARLNFPEKAA